ncbi:hypothetical protein ACJX0J_017096, partial [Zea mays]
KCRRQLSSRWKPEGERNECECVKATIAANGPDALMFVWLGRSRPCKGGGEGESLGTVFLALQCAAHLAAAAVVVHEKPFRSAAHPLALRHDVGVVGRGKEERAADRGIVGSGRTGN